MSPFPFVRTRTRVLYPALAGLVAILSTVPVWGQEAPPSRAEIVHVLNRITFGPRPGDVEMVEKMGLTPYIEQQLHPETIDDSRVDQEVAGFSMLQMSPEQLAELYSNEKKGKKEKKAEKHAEIAATPLAGQPEEPAGTAPSTPSTAMAATPPVPASPIKPAADMYRSDAAIEQLEDAKLIRAVDSQRQLQEVLADFWNNHFNIDVKKKQCRIYKIVDDRDAIRPHLWGKFRDLLEASAKSPAMLYYLDNATSTAAKTPAPGEPSMQPPAAGQLMKPVALATDMGAAPPKKIKRKKSGGINENYARELMELHTIGVDGGYTQQDVQEVARCFTGWSVKKGTGEFVFNANRHDNGSKVVLGHPIPAGGGIQDGETVLDILASSPATAHHISLELCQRFVSDSPSPALVDRIAGVFTKTGGDLRQVTEAILTSPEFMSPANYDNKIKSPLEFAVSAVRASGASILPPSSGRHMAKNEAKEGNAVRGKPKSSEALDKEAQQSLNWRIYELGEPLFACTAPIGYKEVSSTWVSPGALIGRLNFALALTQEQLSDVRFDPKKVLGDADLDQPDEVLQRSVSVLLQDRLSSATKKVLESSVVPSGESKTIDPNKLLALILGSPEFQRK